MNSVICEHFTDQTFKTTECTVYMNILTKCKPIVKEKKKSCHGTFKVHFLFGPEDVWWLPGQEVNRIPQEVDCIAMYFMQ